MPHSVENLLQESKFAHLGTCDPASNHPNVSLMNYGYLEANMLYKPEPKEASYLVFSVRKDATSFKNIVKNPEVSVLVHDWVTAKQTVQQGDMSPLLKFLHSMNQSEISTISATLNGKAIVVKDEKEHDFYQKLLLEEYPENKVFLGEENGIVLIEIEQYKVVDNGGNVERY